MPPITREATCITVGLPLDLCCDNCKPVKDPHSNTRQRPGTVCLRPWDEEVWGNHSHLAKVNLCNKAREYLNLTNDVAIVEEERCYPARHKKLHV